MEFSFDIDTSLPGDNSICIVSALLDVSILDDDRNTPVAKKYISSDNLNRIIDCLGEASSKAQNLQSPITTAAKLQISDHILYIKKENSTKKDGCKTVVGFLKVGHKRLFIVDENGVLHERIPLCILDFYVHESKQRKGYGKELFEAMLKVTNILPHHIAIDRPSTKFVAFLQKHYNLKDIINQANNFVVFRGFFQENKSLSMPVSKQRHSYCGAEYYRSPPIMRPHSLGAGVESCFMWNGVPEAKTPSISTTSSCSSQMSLKSEPPSYRNSTKTNRNQRCSSWNVFGVSPPEYRNGETTPESQYQKLKQCSSERR